MTDLFHTYGGDPIWSTGPSSDAVLEAAKSSMARCSCPDAPCLLHPITLDVDGRPDVRDHP